MTAAESLPPETSPQPPLALVVLSVLVLLVSAFFVGAVGGLPFVVADPAAFMVAILVVPIGLLTATSQFLGTFRHWPGSAMFAGTALLFLSMLELLMVVIGYANSLQSDYPDHYPAESALIFIISLLIGGGMFWTGLLNVLWHNELKRSPARQSIPLWRFSFRELIGAMAVLAVGLAATGYQLRQIPPHWGENVRPSAARYDVPPAARDVCFSRTKGAMALQFTLSEADFLQWVSQGHPHDERWQGAPQPISTTYEITSYWKSNRPPAQKPVAKINHGLYLELTDHRNKVWVAFDRETSRVYLYETWEIVYDP